MMAAPATPALAQTTGELFDARVLHDLRLFVNSRDLEQLRETYLENTYYQADIEWRGERVRSIGIRSRGTGSRNPVKLGLKIDFDRYVSGQRFRGLKELVLDNLWQDPSLLRESLTMALFTRMGQPAPREAYARLFINDVYEGVYAMVEPLDSVFLSRTYGHDRGYLFEYQWLKPFRGEYLGRSLDPYKERFEAENHESQGDSILYSPIHDLFREVNRPQGPNWRAAVDRLLDVRQFLTHVAVEAFVSELDGILGFWAMNNFYLYRPDDATRHQLIVWDRDNAFQEIASSVLLRADDNRLFQRLTAYGDLHAFYVQMVEACARAAAEGGWLENEIAARASLIIDAAHQDTRKSFTNEEFDAQIAFLRTFARQRPAVVLAEVERLRHARSSRAAAAIE
jgi:spore coat protein CotH